MSYYSKPKFTITNHVIKRYIERVDDTLTEYEAKLEIEKLLEDVFQSSSKGKTDVIFITSDGKYEIITTYNFVVKTIVHKK